MWLRGRVALPTLDPPGEWLCPRFSVVLPRWLSPLSTVCRPVTHELYTEQSFYCSFGCRLATLAGCHALWLCARRADRDVRRRLVCHS